MIDGMSFAASAFGLIFTGLGMVMQGGQLVPVGLFCAFCANLGNLVIGMFDSELAFGFLKMGVTPIY